MNTYPITGNDIVYFLSELLNDILHLDEANIISILVRITLVIVLTNLFVRLIKALFRIFWETFGGIFKWFFSMITFPYRTLKKAITKWRRNKKWKEEQKKQETFEAQKIQEEQEKLKREEEAFERIMKQ